MCQILCREKEHPEDTLVRVPPERNNEHGGGMQSGEKTFRDFCDTCSRKHNAVLPLAHSVQGGFYYKTTSADYLRKCSTYVTCKLLICFLFPQFQVPCRRSREHPVGQQRPLHHHRAIQGRRFIRLGRERPILVRFFLKKKLFEFREGINCV